METRASREISVPLGCLDPTNSQSSATWLPVRFMAPADDGCNESNCWWIPDDPWVMLLLVVFAFWGSVAVDRDRSFWADDKEVWGIVLEFGRSLDLDLALGRGLPTLDDDADDATGRVLVVVVVDNDADDDLRRLWRAFQLEDRPAVGDFITASFLKRAGTRERQQRGQTGQQLSQSQRSPNMLRPKKKKKISWDLNWYSIHCFKRKKKSMLWDFKTTLTSVCR